MNSNEIVRHVSRGVGGVWVCVCGGGVCVCVYSLHVSAVKFVGKAVLGNDPTTRIVGLIQTNHLFMLSIRSLIFI